MCDDCEGEKGKLSTILIQHTLCKILQTTSISSQAVCSVCVLSGVLVHSFVSKNQLLRLRH